MKFLIRREQYLEYVAAGNTKAALQCLRQEITPNCSDAGLLHQLSRALVLTDSSSIEALLKWPGPARNREALLGRLEKGPCATWLLPSNRLDELVRQALMAQRSRCLYHNLPSTGMSLLHDHVCERSGERLFSHTYTYVYI